MSTATISPISHFGGVFPGVSATYWTTLARTWEHAADRPCDQPGRVWQTPWRRAQGAAQDTADRAAIDARATAMREHATPVVEGPRCSHVEVRVALAEMNAPKDVRKAYPPLSTRLGADRS